MSQAVGLGSGVRLQLRKTCNIYFPSHFYASGDKLMRLQ